MKEILIICRYNHGQTADTGQSWDQFEEGWKDIEASFNAFLGHCFRESHVSLKHFKALTSVFPAREDRKGALKLTKKADPSIEVKRLDSKKGAQYILDEASLISFHSTPASSNRSEVNDSPRASPSRPVSSSTLPDGVSGDGDKDKPSASSIKGKGPEKKLTFDEERDLRIRDNHRKFRALKLHRATCGPPLRPKPRMKERTNPTEELTESDEEDGEDGEDGEDLELGRASPDEEGNDGK